MPLPNWLPFPTWQNWPGGSAPVTSAERITASIINNLQSAVTTTLNRVYDVTLYGAVGDGVTDDTTAIQAALTAAGAASGIVYFPPKATSYKVTSLNVPQGVALVGNSPPGSGGLGIGSHIRGSAGLNTLVLPGTVSSPGQVVMIHGLTIDGGRSGVYAPHGCTFVRISDCSIAGNEMAAIEILNNSEQWVLDHVQLIGGNYGFYYKNLTNVGIFDSSSFINVHIAGVLEEGIHIESADSNNIDFIHCAILFCFGNGVYLSGNLTNYSFFGLGTENNGQGGIDHNTTGTISASSNQLTLADPTGYVHGTPLTIARAGVGERDLFTTITSIAGNVATLADDAVLSVTNAAVTQSQFADVVVNDDIGGLTGLNFFGGQFGAHVNGGGLRYGLDARGCVNANIFGSNVDGVIYDPHGAVNVISQRLSEKDFLHQPLSRQYEDYLVGRIGHGSRTVFLSPPGNDVDFVLTDIAGQSVPPSSGSGTFGNFNFVIRDSTKSLLAQIDNLGRLILTGSYNDSVGAIHLGGCQILSGDGDPEGVVGADVGSLWLRADGGVGTSLYVKESGSSVTGWVAK